MSGRCPPSSDLSALLDLGLDANEREHLQSHLLDCYLCRDELAELRHTRELLNRTLAETDAPSRPSSDLSARLVNIAGEGAHEPLWTRPFDATRDSQTVRALPSKARRNRRRVVAATVMLSMLVAFVGTGWLAAPDVEEAALTPDAKPRLMLLDSLERRPMGVDPALALMSVGELDRFRTEARGEAPNIATKVPLSEKDSTRLAIALKRGQRAVGVSGLHLAWWRVGESAYQGTARIESSPGQGSEVALYDAGGVLARKGHLSDTAERQPMSLLETHYRLQGFGSASVIAGVPADLIEASTNGRVTARWWVDPSTSTLLWHTAYDPDGQLVASAGLLEMRLDKTTFKAHMGPAIATVSRTSDMPVAAVPALTQRGWSCAAEVAGMPLIKMAHAGQLGAGDSVLYSSYGDGIHAVVVSEQRGALAAKTPGLSWDPELRAYRNDHNPTEVSWQSGKKVFTVSVSGGEEHLRAAVAALPHDPPLLRTRTERVLSGWQAIFGMRG